MTLEQIEKELLKVLRKSNNSEEFKKETEKFIKNYKKFVIKEVLKTMIPHRKDANDFDQDGQIAIEYKIKQYKKLAKDKYNIDL